ncbi:hypothetical protein MUK42_21443 [Musa troglodytarum]|uniref:Uncharacterized protein n=1 Tax=Musa troglodytarum TaxID=320322 RepID=A0A9E7IGQ4_9LILI|nr:hypothetical protein MUK42_21443 [Musa troglodytarum]
MQISILLAEEINRALFLVKKMLACLSDEESGVLKLSAADPASSDESMGSPKHVFFCCCIFSQASLGTAVCIGHSVFMHNPIGLHSSRRFPGVKDQGFLDCKSCLAPLGRDRLISTSRLPVSLPGSPVRPRPVRINLGDDRDGQALAGYLPAKVVHDELFVGGVEPESRRQVELGLRVSLPRHPCLLCWPTANK